MTDDGIGRLLVASLHQSIGEVLPTRLEYYEHWLSPMGLREGRSGLAPLGAVLIFLRQEGEGPYTRRDDDRRPAVGRLALRARAASASGWSAGSRSGCAAARRSRARRGCCGRPISRWS